MDPRLSSAFHDQVAASYDGQMGSFADAAVRSAFQTFVSAQLPSGARILDFGCGTGTDASWYANRGFRVLAFDNSPGMIGELRIRCAEAIARVQIQPWADSYETFLADLESRDEVQAVTANFAVINLIPDLATWFATIGRILPREGAVFLTALNPLSLDDLRAPRRLFNALRFAFDVGVPSPDALNPLTRYWPRAIARAARGFRLERIAGAGFLVRVDGQAAKPDRFQLLRERIERRLWQTKPWSHLGRFFFLELRRC